MRFLLSLFILLAAVCLVRGEPTDEAWAQLWREAKARPRRLIVNDDGCDAFNYPTSKEVSEKAFIDEMLRKLEGTKFDVLCYCPGSVGLTFSYASRFADRFTPVTSGDKRDVTERLVEVTGRHPMEIARDFAKRNGMEFFASIRVNDTHDRFFPTSFSHFKKTHPDWLCGTKEQAPPRGSWTSFDYGRPEVRQYLVDIADEMVRKFDADGLELDFYRDDCFLKSWAWYEPVTQEELDGLTEMARAIRRNAEAYGRARGRPVLIAMRMADSPEICRAQGLDIRRWMAEGLLDMLFSGGDHGNFAPYAVMRDLCVQHGIAFYPAVDLSNIRAAGVFDRNRQSAYDGLAAAAYAAGADGLYSFNMFYNPAYFKFAEPSYEKVVRRNKTYFPTVQMRWSNHLLDAEERRHDLLPLLSPACPHPMKAGPLEVVIQTGEDAEAHPMERAELHVALTGEPRGLDVLFNGTALKLLRRKDDVATYAVPAAVIRKGLNTLRFSIADDDVSESNHIILQGNKLLKVPEQFPWRRLAAGPYPLGTESIVDDAYRIHDQSADTCIHLLYPLAGLGGAPLSLSFTMRTLPEAAPKSAVLRIANGKHVEIIEFRPDHLHLEYAQADIPFDTLRFHDYEVRLADGCLFLRADGALLWEGRCVASTDDLRRIAIPDCTDAVPGKDTESLLIGSMSKEGKGASEWRNLVLKEALTVKDAVLEVTMPPLPLTELKAALAAPHAWGLDIRYPEARYPQGTRNDYAVTPHPDGGALFDNDTNHQWRIVQTGALPFLAAAGRFAAMEFEAAVVRPPKAATDYNGMAAIKLPTLFGGSGCLTTLVKFSETALQTPWKEVPLTPGLHRFTMAIDRENGGGLVMVDGAAVATGELRPDSGEPCLYWGDGSSVISGAFRMTSVRVAVWGDASTATGK